MGARAELLAGAEGASCSVLETMDRLEGAPQHGGRKGLWKMGASGPRARGAARGQVPGCWITCGEDSK